MVTLTTISDCQILASNFLSAVPESLLYQSADSSSGLLSVDTAYPLKGLFQLLRAFKSITDPQVQRQILQHSLDLLDLSQGSKVRLLRHDTGSATGLVNHLRRHAPQDVKDDHVIMLRGPKQDMVSSMLHSSIPAKKPAHGRTLIYLAVPHGCAAACKDN